ncbi:MULTISPECIES: MerR family transcriptional regulator [Paenibacillus]|uniref:MerR family transcriptional regulator n=1 Tax=Paenibacillus TaxID=44249 RepID=UPI00203A4BD4|nr:MerR family transcriptional regulator [Paenibacillus camelliae]MCM3635446.1 peptidoglycan bridge formation glycyltransferase FemA/FemB family protein [Paenibacillus camelliae]
MTEATLLRIGELAERANISSRTIDYYTSIGLIMPAKRSKVNYRLYNVETLERLERIESLKKDKYTLDEIKNILEQWDHISPKKEIKQKLSELEKQLHALQREVKELEPVLDQLKPKQAKHLYSRLLPQTAACMEALMILINKGSII